MGKFKELYSSKIYFSALLGFLSIILILLIASLITNISAVEHYRRVFEKPLVVNATIIGYKAYDNDGDTQYRTYVSYVTGKTLHKNVLLRSGDSEDELIPMGTELKLNVSPEEPYKLISSLRKQDSVLIWWTAISILIAVVWYSCFNFRLSNNKIGSYEIEIIHKDLKLTVCSRLRFTFCIFMSVGFGFFTYRYPMLISGWMYVVAAVFFILFVISVCIAVRDIRIINKSEYEVRKDVLIDKQKRSTDDTDFYELTYRTKDKTWKTSTSSKQYDMAKKGDVVLAIYLPNRKKPVLLYNETGAVI